MNLSNLFFKESLIQVTGKGNKQRLVPMGSVSKKHLEVYIKQVRNFQKIDNKYKDLVFLNRNGKQLTRQMIFTLIRTLGSKAKIDKKIFINGDALDDLVFQEVCICLSPILQAYNHR